jgi:hypothetical protein
MTPNSIVAAIFFGEYYTQNTCPEEIMSLSSSNNPFADRFLGGKADEVRAHVGDIFISQGNSRQIG